MIDLEYTATQAQKWLAEQKANNGEIKEGVMNTYLDRKECAEALVTAHELLQQQEWQPIKTCPEDGSEFLIWCAQEGCQDNKTRPLVTRIKDGLYEGLMFWDVPLYWKPIAKPNSEKNNDTE